MTPLKHKRIRAWPQTNLQKAMVILIWKDLVISGKGRFEAKNIHGNAVFTATFVKPFPLPKRGKK